MLIYEAGNTMKYFTKNKKALKYILVIAVVAVLLTMVTSCEEMGFPSSTPKETPAPEPEVTVSSTTAKTSDAAKLAVYQHLLELATGYDAKMYLSDFYTTCDNWTAQSDYFKDGTGTWHVTVNMTATDDWAFRPYWQQASWLVFKDGKVIPSNLFRANALRIEADLQALHPEPADTED
jgi:hypothetical protein